MVIPQGPLGECNPNEKQRPPLLIAQLMDHGWGTSPRFPYLGSGWTDCAEIWYVVRDPLAWRFTEADDVVHLHFALYTGSGISTRAHVQ